MAGVREKKTQLSHFLFPQDHSIMAKFRDNGSLPAIRTRAIANSLLHVSACLPRVVSSSSLRCFSVRLPLCPLNFFFLLFLTWTSELPCASSTAISYTSWRVCWAASSCLGVKKNRHNMHQLLLCRIMWPFSTTLLWISACLAFRWVDAMKKIFFLNPEIYCYVHVCRLNPFSLGPAASNLSTYGVPARQSANLWTVSLLWKQWKCLQGNKNTNEIFVKTENIQLRQ